MFPTDPGSFSLKSQFNGGNHRWDLCENVQRTLDELEANVGKASLLFQDIALMNEQERDGFIRKIGISAGDSDELEDDEEENDPEHLKYNCKKCQVRFLQTVAKTFGRRHDFVWFDGDAKHHRTNVEALAFLSLLTEAVRAKQSETILLLPSPSPVCASSCLLPKAGST